MKFRFSKSAMMLAAGGALVANMAMADGRVQGRISAASGNINLNGALVRIEELNLQVVSEDGGRFSFPSIKAGEYTLSVQYLGAAPVKKRITVAEGDLLQNIVLQKESTEMEELVVVGQVAAIGSALNRQRASDAIVSIVSSDAIGQFPDSNVSEALQRVPGVSIERDQGEGRYVRVRGLGPDFNAVTINGMNVPSPDADRRAVALDVIPSDLLESLEVSKTVTPDQDANSLGGAIEVKSLSAFDRDELFFKVSAENSYNDFVEENSPKLSFTASNIFSVGDDADNLGVALSVSWFKRKFGSDNVETGGKWKFDDDAALLQEIEQRDYTIERERLGLGFNVDYRIGDSSSVYLRTLYSEYTDEETRLANVAVFEDEDNDIDGIAVGETGTITEAVRELKNREETQEITTISFGGETLLDQWRVNYDLGFSEASEHEPYHIDGTKFEYDGDDLDAAMINGTRKPVLSVNDAFYDASQYFLDEIETAESYTKDTKTNFKLDLTREFDLSGMPSSLKFGVKVSQREKEAGEDVTLFERDDEALSNHTGGEVDYGIGRFGPSISVGSVLGLLNQSDSEVDIEKTAIGDTRIDEDITAAYAMWRSDINDLRVIAGVRYEKTEQSSSGKLYNDDDESITGTTFENDDSHVLPALHLRYQLGEQQILRFAWTNTLARPSFDQINPGVVLEDDEAEAGNPGLKALEAANLDLSYEYYFGRSGLASVGVFYKDIDNFIYQRELDGSVIGMGSDITVDTFANGDSAELLGVELALSGQIEALPGFLYNFNATFTDSEATLIHEEGSRDINLPNQSDTTLNASIGYENDWISTRLAAVYKSKYLLEVGALDSDEEDIWEDNHMQIDFTANVYISEQMQVYFKAININDEAFYTFQRSSAYNTQYEEYGRTFVLGVQYTSF
jgi:TonB-dependent receptor